MYVFGMYQDVSIVYYFFVYFICIFHLLPIYFRVPEDDVGSVPGPVRPAIRIWTARMGEGVALPVLPFTLI